VDNPERLGAAWDEALASDRPVGVIVGSANQLLASVLPGHKE